MRTLSESEIVQGNKVLKKSNLCLDVRTTDGHVLAWDKRYIIEQLLRETKLAEQFYGLPSCGREEAEEIAKETEDRIKKMGLTFLSGPLIRELVNIILLERGRSEWRNVLTRVGMLVDANIDIFEKIKIEEKFFPIVDGGDIFHIFLGEGAPNQNPTDLTMNIAKKTPIGYFAFTKDMTICLDDYTITGGIADTCPICGGKNLEHWSRVTGYLQAVSGWNEAKKQELKERYRYSMS
jgi:anaerobic ribonucleoside-triphosphate reductase